MPRPLPRSRGHVEVAPPAVVGLAQRLAHGHSVHLLPPREGTSTGEVYVLSIDGGTPEVDGLLAGAALQQLADFFDAAAGTTEFVAGL